MKGSKERGRVLLRKIILLLFLMSLIKGWDSSAVEYFVALSGRDGAAGTRDDPWRSFRYAAKNAPPGSTISFLSGVYLEKVVVETQGSLEEGPVVFRAYPGEKVILSGEGVPKNDAMGSDSLLYIEDKSYLTIQGFEMRDLRTEDGAAVHIQGAGRKIIIEGNTIHEIRGGGENGGASGILVYGTKKAAPLEEVEIIGNEVYDCDPAKSEAIAVNGNVRAFKIIGNQVHDVNNIGIDMIGGEPWLATGRARDGVCKENIVYRAHSAYEGGYAAGIYVDGGLDIAVEDNEVFHCDLGIEVGAENSGVKVTGVTVINNRIHHNDKAGLIFGGYSKDTGMVENCLFEKNWLFSNDMAGTGVGEIFVQHAAQCEVLSNTIHPDQGIAFYVSKESLNILFNKNIYCRAQGRGELRFLWKGKEYRGLPAFQKTGEESEGRTCIATD